MNRRAVVRSAQRMSVEGTCSRCEYSTASKGFGFATGVGHLFSVDCRGSALCDRFAWRASPLRPVLGDERADPPRLTSSSSQAGLFGRSVPKTDLWPASVPNLRPARFRPVDATGT